MKGSLTAVLRITGIRPSQRSKKKPSEGIGQALRLIRWPTNHDTPDDILIVVSIENAARESAVLQVLPQLWARNTWSWNGAADRPRLRKAGLGDVLAFSPGKKTRRLCLDCSGELLLCENAYEIPARKRIIAVFSTPSFIAIASASLRA
jgi:hypothetical protein